MNEFRCKSCGAELDIISGKRVTKCKYCGTLQTIPFLIDEKNENIYNRANQLRRNNEYDKASALYEELLIDNPNDSDLYWSLVLCHYGIEYVNDALTGKKIPTINRAQYTAIFDDVNYKQAITNAGEAEKEIYEREANIINDIQKKYLDISLKEEPFDVFICYKETDERSNRTKDSVLANQLYDELVSQGYKVFYSRITLEDKLGVAYEPYIFQALNTAKVMVVIGTCKEYFEAVWVKNEWSRFLTLCKKDKEKVLIPAYLNMNPYDLPDEFKHLQAQDMSKLGFIQTLVKGINKLIKIEEGSGSIAGYMKRATFLIEDERYSEAKDVLNKALNIDPTNANIYLGLLLVDYQIKAVDELATLSRPIDKNNNYIQVFKFGENDLKKQLIEISSVIEVNYQKEQELEAIRRKKKRNKRLLILLAIAAIGILTYFGVKYYTTQPSYIAKQVESEKINLKSIDKLYKDDIVYNLANFYKENDELVNARECYDKILYYKSSKQYRDEIVKRDFDTFMSDKDYDNAINLLVSLKKPTELDVSKLKRDAKLAKAQVLFNEEKYDDALNIYTSYKDEVDLSEKINIINVLLKEKYYKDFVNYLAEKEYLKANDIYKKIVNLPNEKKEYDLAINNHIVDIDKMTYLFSERQLIDLINLVKLVGTKIMDQNVETLKRLYLSNFPNGTAAYSYRIDLNIKENDYSSILNNKNNLNNVGTPINFENVKARLVISNDINMSNGDFSKGYVDSSGKKYLDFSKPVYIHIYVTEVKSIRGGVGIGINFVKEMNENGHTWTRYLEGFGNGGISANNIPDHIIDIYSLDVAKLRDKESYDTIIKNNTFEVRAWSNYFNGKEYVDTDKMLNVSYPYKVN